MRVEEGILRQLFGVGILNDRSDLNVRKGEGLRHVLQTFGFDDRFVERLAFKFGHGTVWMYGSSPDVGDLVTALLVVWDFNIGVLPALFLEDLDSHEVVL